LFFTSNKARLIKKGSTWEWKPLHF
jgi:hypothetical protein